MRLWPMPRCAGEAEPHAARSHHGVVVCGGTPIRPTGPADGDGRRSLSALGDKLCCSCSASWLAPPSFHHPLYSNHAGHNWRMHLLHHA